MGALNCKQRCCGKYPDLDSIDRFVVEDILLNPTNSKSPNDDTVTKLTAQVELLETKIEQLQKENIMLSIYMQCEKDNVKATSKQKDVLKEKLENLEQQQALKQREYYAQTSSLEATVKDLNDKLQSANNSAITQVEKEKRSREKESLERAAAAASERDQLKVELKVLKNQLSTKEKKYSAQINSLEATVEDLNGKLQSANTILQLSNRREYTSRINNLEATVHDLRGNLQEIMNNKAQEQPKPKTATTSTASPTDNTAVIKKVYICSSCKRFETEDILELKQHMTNCARSRGQIVPTN